MISEERFAFFRDSLRYYLDLLGLYDWRLSVTLGELHGDDADSSAVAHTHCDLRHVWVILSDKYEERDEPCYNSDGDAVFPLSLDELAAHEIFHVMSADVLDCAMRRRHAAAITEANERMTAKMARVLARIRKEIG